MTHAAQLITTHGNPSSSSLLPEQQRSVSDPGFLNERAGSASQRVFSHSARTSPIAVSPTRVSTKEPFSQKVREEAIIIAAQGGHLGAVQVLLQSGQISEKARLSAIGHAVIGKHLLVIQALSLDLEEFLGTVIEFTAQQGDVGILLDLFTQKVILEEHRGLVIILASQLDRSEIVYTLLDGTISDEDRWEATLWAFDNKDFKLAEELLNSGPIPDRGCGEAVVGAAQCCLPPKLIDKLLKSGPISEEDHGQAIREAGKIFSNHTLPEVMKTLLGAGIASDEDCLEALAYASDPAVVKELLKAAIISTEARTELIEKANPEIARLLKCTHPIGVATRSTDENLLLKDVEKWLEENPSTEDFEDAFGGAIDFGSLTIVEKLLHNRHVSQRVRNDALITAAGNGSTDIVCTLLGFSLEANNF